jgi:AcrR family transcriptional regulator
LDTLLKKESPNVPNKAEKRKEHIMNCAEKVFAQKGYQEATISDIAREANLSDTTIYEYFSTKEELLFTIPEATTEKFKELLEFNLKSVRDAGNKIRSFIYFYLWFYKSHPDYASLYLLTLKSSRKFRETRAYQIIRGVFRNLLNIINQGIEKGELRKEIDPYLLRAQILGTIEHIVVRWLLIDNTKDLMDNVDPIYEMIMEGAGKINRTRGLRLRVEVEDDDSTSGTGERNS